MCEFVFWVAVKMGGLIRLCLCVRACVCYGMVWYGMVWYGCTMI